MRFVGICQYDGSNYSGFQSQKNASSIQDYLEFAIGSIGTLEGRINYAGRTDAGVHATGQIFDFLTNNDRDTNQWLKGLNSLLPNDISVSSIQKVSEKFHSRFDAINRTYSYVIYIGKAEPIFFRDYVYWEKNKIDLDIMRDEASHLIGTHNFNSFRGSKCTSKNPVRTIKSIDITKKENFIIITLCANAYLYNMVRIIVGTLLEISKGSSKNINAILNSQDRKNAGNTAKARGLFFTGAEYKKIDLDISSRISNPLSFFNELKDMKLKICGIRDIDILKYTCDMGVNFAGFIMPDDSPRKISNNFISSLENFNFKDTLPVFVFVNPSRAEVLEITTKFNNAILQFHGDESEDFCKQFNQPFWKTIRIKNSQSLESINNFASADALLLETYVDDSYGGTGKEFDWTLLRNIQLCKKFVLAGGINSKNIKEAISLNPWCIDVNSGVESSLASKDKSLMAQIIKNFKMNNLSNLPNSDGFFGEYGGKFVPETLMHALKELDETYSKLKNNPKFIEEIDQDLVQFVGRPSPLYFAKRLTNHYSGPQIWLKREDLNHTGAHKINNTVGQILLAKAMGKKRIIAETGAGQHGVATATVAARLGLECHIYMGAKDVERQSLNVYRIKLLGAEVHAVDSGTATLKDALNEAMRDWVTNIEDTYYIIGSVTGPHPYPMIVRDFNAIVGRELRKQSIEQFSQYPDAIIACVGGGSNAMGIFYPFLEESNVELIGVEAAGSGLMSGKHAAPLNDGEPGILHGAKSYLMQDENGQVIDTHSVSAGLDYPGVGPEHSNLKDSGRANYIAVDDKEVIDSFHLITKLEGIMPALETAHAFAALDHIAKNYTSNQHIVINVSGRGDKDINTVATMDGISLD